MLDRVARAQISGAVDQLAELFDSVEDLTVVRGRVGNEGESIVVLGLFLSIDNKLIPSGTLIE